MSIRLATYNIHKFVGRDGKRNEERILDIIGTMQANILALQEFVLKDQSGNIAMVEEFAAKVGYHYIAQPMRRRRGMVQFNLLLTRTPAHSNNLVTLPRDGFEPRGFITAKIKADGQELQIAATHLGLNPTARMRQIKLIVELCAQPNQAPFALLGDLNTMFPWEAAKRFLGQEFPGQQQPATFPARLPLLALDSIYLRPARMVQSLRTFTDGAARNGSDHLPLIADIALT